jgi:arginine-tRNA-protein transferase
VKVLQRIFGDPETCAYLPDRSARLEFRLAVGVAPRTMERLLERGWRRFGFAYFRPACAGCTECVSIRVPVDRFRPSRSQRRTIRAGGGLRWTWGTPRVDEARLDLLHRWHLDREQERGWQPQVMDAERYELEFAVPHPCARELAAWERDDDRNGPDRLVALGIVDETPRALSAAYTFFDPARRDLSPGTLVALRMIELARERGKRHVYLGYRVRGCPSSQYKERFRPHQLARGWPDLREPPPRWTDDSGHDVP